MDLRQVKPGKRLFWPVPLFDSLCPDGSGAAKKRGIYGWRQDTKRNQKMRLRGEEGYVVDLDAPLESEWCKENGKALEAMPKKRGRPRKADVIDFEPALHAIAAYKEKHGIETPASGVEPQGTETSEGPVSGSDASESGALASPDDGEFSITVGEGSAAEPTPEPEKVSPPAKVGKLRKKRGKK